METHTEILPDFQNKCIIALKVINSNSHLAVQDLDKNHGLDTGLTLRGYCDDWEKFILHQSENHISLQNLAGGFLSPSEDDQWTFCGHQDSWEKLDILVKEENSLTQYIAISTQNIDGEYGLQKRYLAPRRIEGIEYGILRDEPYYWEIMLAEPPAINIYPIVGKIDSSSTLQSLSVCNLNIVKKIVRAHKEIGFFHVIGHKVPLDIFSIFKSSIGIVPWEDDRKFDDEKRKKNYELAQQWPGKDVELKDHDWWPQSLDNKVRSDYFKNCTKLADTLLHTLALGQELVSKKFPAWRQIFQINAYLAVRGLVYHPGPIPEDEKFLTTAGHTDATWITLLVEDDVGGLEIRKGYEWVEVPSVKGGIIVNTGNVLEHESGGANSFYKSACHRVVRVSDSKTRFSMPFFYDRVGSKTGGC